MTKCPQCGYDETQLTNQKLVSNIMNHYVDEKGNVVGLVASNEKILTFGNKTVTRQDLWKAPVEVKTEVKK